MRFAEFGRERQGEDLVADIIADVQDPAAPVFRARRHDERPHNDRGVLTRLSQVAYDGAASIDQYPLRVGAMEIDLSHVPPPAGTKCRVVWIAARMPAENSARCPKPKGSYGGRGRFAPGSKKGGLSAAPFHLSEMPHKLGARPARCAARVP